MIIVNPIFISKEIPKLLRMGGFECQLMTSKSGVCLCENRMFVDRQKAGGGGPKFRLCGGTS